ncbi:MAG: twin-arginine translocase subunit TatC [Deltaproteobacteria bacterium]|nr:twin-arginine translocase subunit TatC [Deltaproteobacteria bacterium]MCX7952025.1 twin-arginine translocase subunit TatC [Deltaproteobacteria bacterium]
MEKLKEFTLLEHVEELRKRILYSLYSTGICSAICFVWSAEILRLILRPFKATFSDFDLVGLSPGEAFTIRILLSLWSGLLTASPLVIYQVWKFIEPGLYSAEKRTLTSVFWYTIILFLAGVCFGYGILLPYSLGFFLTQFEVLQIKPTIRLSEYLSLLVRLTLASGIVFLMPVASFVMARLGLLTAEFLKANFRISVVIIFVLSAIITPPDVFTQIILALPMILLYFLSIVTARRGEK